MKYKKLTKEQIIISLDRLTRFKNTKEKYFRVFSDILISNLIEPKLKKSDIENIDYSIIAEYVSEIFNNSIESVNNNIYINKYLKDYENNIFVNNNETQKLLDNNINYIDALKLVPEDCPVNLKWLNEMSVLLSSFQSLSAKELQQLVLKNPKQVRNDKKLKFPIEEVILVEGITEEILLPVFARLLGYDFYAHGIQVIAAGGKNQVVKMYYKLSQELRIPIFVLLDKDAEDNINQIKPRLRDNDRIHLVSCGEFEDLLPKELIIRTVNSHFENFLAISEKDLNQDLPTAKILEELFKTQGLHEFKKAEFAKLIREQIKSDGDVSQEIRAIVDEIKFTNKVLDT